MMTERFILRRADLGKRLVYGLKVDSGHSRKFWNPRNKKWSRSENGDMSSG